MPLIIAHRGASALAPENTLAAFRRAVEDGADGVEFDVRLAKDGVPVVVHDASLLRTAGIKKRVCDLTAEQLSRIDAGSWFNAYPRHTRSAFADEGVPTLRSVLQTLETIDGPIYIELKCERGEDVSPVVDAVCREIADSPRLGNVIIKSFHLAVIPRARAVLPGVQTAALFAPKIMRLLRKEKYLINIASELGADHLSLHKSMVSRKLVRQAEKRGLPVTVWTVNASRWVPRGAKLGLFAMITNDPTKLLRTRESTPPARAQAGKPKQKTSRADSQPAE